MEIQRTANAGVLLRLDGVTILLDGLCESFGPYLGTPAKIAEKIAKNPPDLLAFTHGHPDHFGESLVSEYGKQNLRPILGPESLPCGAQPGSWTVGGFTVTPIATRHLGMSDVEHRSYLIAGSKRVLFTGDAAPLQFKGKEPEHVDVLIAPYAFANTVSSWKMSCALADATVLLHLPDRECDEHDLYLQVKTIAGDAVGSRLYIPEVGETLQM